MTPEEIHEASESMKAEFISQIPDGDVVSEDEITETAKGADIYQQSVNRRKEIANKPIQHGASTLTQKIAAEALGDLARAHKRAEVDSDYWKERGDKERAQIVKDQYIEENFLPAVEMVVIASNPDEILNAKDILREFDKLSMQYGPGYTESYIRTAYGNQLGSTSAKSDGYVQSMVERIKYLSANDQIRTAYGISKKLKEEIDNGEHIANDVDYEIISRVASIG